jgi:cytochrome P450
MVCVDDEATSEKPAPAAPRLAGLPMADDRTAAYAMLRDAGPVARTRFGSYSVTSAEAAEFVLKHPEQFSSRQATDVVGSPVPMVPVAFDPPEHTRYRQILQPFFSPRGIASWLPDVRALAAVLIDRLARQGECDLVADLAVPLPAQVFLSLFGLPLEDRDRLIAWKDGLIRDFGQMSPADPARPGAADRAQRRGRLSEQTMRLGAELYEYLVGHIARRRQHEDTSDLLGQLLADRSGERLDDREILGLSFLFVLAGLETVTSALSTAFALLAARPGLRRQVVAEPSCIPGAVEELLRFDGPILFVPRIAAQDVRLAGQLIPAGSTVNVFVSAADRDPGEHADPDVIDLGRQERHLAFGVGPHRCLGSHLARMELRVTMEEWHRRIPEYQLAPGVTPRAAWPSGLVGIRSLPLVFPRG